MLAHQRRVLQLYDDELNLITAVGRAMSIALDQGHRVVCIATDVHRELLETHLTRRGIDLQAVRESEEFVCLDATRTLATITRDGVPDGVRFAQVVGAAIDDVAGRFPRMWVFSELVALICANGNDSGAVELEKLWESFIAARPSFLHCEYPPGMVWSEQDGAAFVQVCEDHCRVLHGDSSLALAVSDQSVGTVRRA